ncbi:Uma2 family endonuclease [Streptomyces barkulensis]|uniref:Uma2 family endonuclease n=1 Tax=Streptomyces barkulensis TaxID=1257026 RepID=UPI000C6D6EA3|nr:Uma2 family endonuclease [Streptomyces barkulensis]
MTALTHEAPEVTGVDETDEDPGPHGGPQAPPRADLDEALWQAWKTLELPEGFHAEIVEGSIEVSPTGRHCHGQIVNRLRRALERFLDDGDHVAYQDMNVIHELTAYVPDLFVAPEDDTEHVTEDGLGLKASCVEMVVEVVSPGHRSIERDRVHKRRAYARAGVPVYVLIDDHDGHGTVTVLTSPSPGEAVYAAETRVPYGTEVAIPDGAAKGFVIGEAITGPRRGA